MNYHNITKEDMLNGDGIRVVLWVAGCEHHCPECQNPETWSHDSGIEFDQRALEEIYHEMNKDYVSGITFSGGDPLSRKNAFKVSRIINSLKTFHPEKTVWIYTGYTLEELLDRGDEDTLMALRLADVLVDGEYEKDLRDIKLKWRGSSNQRVIDLKKTRETTGPEGLNIVLHCD